MLRTISTHIFLRQRLHPGLLETLMKGGAQGIEIFAARQHFDYTSKTHVKEIALWFSANPVEPFSMHMPIFGDAEMGRSGAPAINVVHPEKSRRIDAMDEVKRALETAEEMPLRHLILHLGEREDLWSPRTLEHAMTAIEHLQAFARPLGVKILLENIQNEVTEAVNLLEIVRIGHFKDVGVCLDVGHAHLGGGIAAAIGELKPLIRSAHIHDNHGQRDEHLWPGDATIPWAETMQELRTAPQLSAAVLEINYLPEDSPEHVASRAAETFKMLEL
ncbi:MAG TPA: sugar phosphate isomerase/epimerase family protein [Acidobacteriaceae bacterium]|nr:sugar phosphate isomerase/epimerase family protein [Acidobacteriaceae bacterium]